MIDLVASAPHYRAHAEPVWAALPADLRGPGDVALVASWADHRLARARGYRRFVVMEHGIGQSYGNDSPGYPGGARREADLFLAPNEHSARRWQATYPAARVEVIGSPRLDALPARNDYGDDRPVVAVSFHWACAMVPETRPALDHFRSALPELARRFHLIGHSHPRANLSSLYRRLGVEYVRSFDEVCRRADVFVADNTSALYEFASTDRPVVVLNPPWYRPHAHHGLRFWDAAPVGVQVDRSEDLADAVAFAIADPPERQAARETALAIVYGYRTGASARGAAAIVDWLADDARAAA